MKITKIHGVSAGLLGMLLFASAYQTNTTTRPPETVLDSLYRQLTDEQKRLPENALLGLKIADGLDATLFASEPTITNPTNIDVDAKGRVWVCEAYNYRPAINGNPSHKEGDRIMILEDTNGDGKSDVSKVFYQGPEINAPLGIWVMGNKVLVSQSPYVYLFTDENGDDKADKKEIVFEGISGEQHDHGMHAFVFGPDGKFYFNFGNEGQQLKDKENRFIKDIEGNEIAVKNYKQGVVFRCDPDFKNLEVLGQNFRNNYEVAVDSYGTLWQSDNDDDGNKGVRINYVMEYGNYGYTDEITGAGWQANRTNIEPEIPRRHWHLNDPGVVPNLLQTGAGSPTGMVVYEGTLLPEPFRNQMIHCDAGPNVVRSYPVSKDGAGYKASIVNIMEGVRDQWFRPSDVCVAPDGSLLVADWYDPGVGGHQAGDQNRGRIFRVAPSNTPYKIPTYNLSTIEDALKALENPNLSVRYQAWNAIHNMGTKAEKALSKYYKANIQNPRLQARALWLLTKIDGKGKKYVETALKDANPDIRITALRAARELKLDIIPYVKQLISDPDAQVRRECVIALHHNSSTDAPALWAKLAQQYDGKDRWYLEALGIGADKQWDSYFSAWLKVAGTDADVTASPANRDIIWRARTGQAVPLLAKLASESSTDISQRLRYFRAFDFIPDVNAKSIALLKMLEGSNSDQTQVNKLALNHLDPASVRRSETAMNALRNVLTSIQGTQEYLELVSRYELEEENDRLLKMALEKNGDRLGRDAAGLLLKQNGGTKVREIINGKDEKQAVAMLTALRSVGSKESLQILEGTAFNSKNSLSLRREAAGRIGNSWDGEERVLTLLKEGKVPEELKASLVNSVSGAWRKSVRTEAASYLGKTATVQKHPALDQMLTMKGDATNGVTVFKNNCSVCHQVKGEGMDFGPKLTEIGSKLPREAQYISIMHPDAGISFGYEGYEIKLKDGSTIAGIIASKTETDLQLKMPGGIISNYKMAKVASIKQMESSMMPSGLADNMTTQELVDLVAYLVSLKKAN
ncbi:c-type cytochrome [Cytophagaceae bacterium DM2B3-1]|uniref:C-type cytochrome n=1 Tax=Xanthocytophaga flava TaxID=3048013 RepID=A0ABT7CQ04_9BACT|nr:PVC-type heme-binding CxxCH protein [Xanthocytophaga flavus]MDJ1471177.1 c-type cytochrome [Xanthocytophaga flavus]MDJ1495823.1 c-type cytochrome [Xanthocytophaga flavus]